MKNLINFIKKFIPKELPKPVGRWSNEYCDIKMNQRVDLSNEDHCGPCGQYLLSKKESTETHKKVDENNNKV